MNETFFQKVCPVIHTVAKIGICALLFCPAAIAQETSEQSNLLDTLASELAAQIEKTPVAGNKIVLLVPFSLSNEIQKRLASRATNFLIMDTSVVQRLIDEDKLDPRDLQNVQAALWLGSKYATAIVVYGETKEVDDEIEVTLTFIDTLGDPKRVAAKMLGSSTEPKPQIPKFSTRLKRTTELIKALSDFDSKLAIPKDGPGGPSPDAQGVYKAGVAEIGTPECLYCPNPSFTDEAVWARGQGKAILRVVVGEEGQILSVEPVRGIPYGLTGQAINAVSKWRLKPATNGAGIPVKTRMVVEVIFRQH